MATGGLVAVFLDKLPLIAAILAVLWYAIQIYESATVQRIVENFKARLAAKRLGTNAEVVAAVEKQAAELKELAEVAKVAAAKLELATKTAITAAVVAAAKKEP